MEKITGKLTVFFDNPFWVGVFECVEKNKLSVWGRLKRDLMRVR